MSSSTSSLTFKSTYLRPSYHCTPSPSNLQIYSRRPYSADTNNSANNSNHPNEKRETKKECARQTIVLLILSLTFKSTDCKTTTLLQRLQQLQCHRQVTYRSIATINSNATIVEVSLCCNTADLLHLQLRRQNPPLIPQDDQLHYVGDV
ncbi:Hypothetical predicted protein [Olea europaea subsp. europaea]|uniref:Uncharacterized protein n=1 Tax=Olea europaea subsp. europaea TaxID=158383 RepID=A0A8S0Q953_OLEEU|nr:Hypothetical predicted protein [Olea europaea subsp. europaea]